MPGPDFETVVADYYEPLYRFAVSLTRSEAEACDLAQQAFFMWATKGHQLRGPVKSQIMAFHDPPSRLPGNPPHPDALSAFGADGDG